MFVVVTAVNVKTQVRTRRALRDSGLDPYAAGAHVVTGLGQGQGATPDLEKQLDQLDDLHRRGRISVEEHASARAELLGGG